MIQEFMTKRNACGHREHLIIDHEKKTFSIVFPHIIPRGVEITRIDWRRLVDECNKAGYVA